MIMRKVVVFGAGGTGRRVYEMIKTQNEVLYFVDNDEEKWGQEYDGKKILSPDTLKRTKEYEAIYLGTLMGLSEVQEQMREIGLPLALLEKSYVEVSVNARILFLKRVAERMDKERIEGAVAEAGVFRGEFAKEINRFFCKRKCYLFDTFEGFDEKDFAYEEEESMTEDAKHLRKTSENLVRDKMPYKDMVVIRKGYFPDTTVGLDEKFCFVNLDMDLYRPTLEGLRYFYPRLSDNGIIVIHDYFTEIYPNIEKALDDFEKELGVRLRKMPIGDDISIAIIK